MRKIMVALLLLTAAVGAFSQARTGAWLMSTWQASKTDPQAAALFRGYLLGVADTDARIFFRADGVSPEMMIDVLSQWLDENAGNLGGLTADECVDRALGGKWPMEDNPLRPRISARS